MSNVRKFLFDTEFGADGTVLRDPARNEFKRFEPAEVEAVRVNALEEGKKDATAQAERAAAAALDALARDASALLARLDALAQQMREHAAAVALAAARKIAGEALDAHGDARVVAAVAAAMEALPHGPRLVVRVAPASEAALRPRLERMAKERLYDGALVVRAVDGAQAGDVAIDWSEGGVAIERADIEARVSALVDAALAAPADAAQAGSNP